MIKNDLASQLTNAKNNYIMGLAALYLFGNDESYPILAKGHATFGQYNITFEQVTNLLKNEKDRNIAVKELLKIVCNSSSHFEITVPNHAQKSIGFAKV